MYMPLPNIANTRNTTKHGGGGSGAAGAGQSIASDSFILLS